jgi:pimeloyl-ACP methyl ester carboxylesterase
MTRRIAASIPSAIRERVKGVFDWAFPPERVEYEVIERVPEGGSERPPILFVHGLAHAAWCWDEYWMPELCERGWACYALSFRGHGGSSGFSSRKRATLRHYVHDVMQVIAELPERPILVGHSMGALVTMRVLERYRARAGVLVAPVAADTGLRMAASIAMDTPVEFMQGLLLGKPLDLYKERLFSDEMNDVTARRFLARMETPTALNQYELMLPRRTRPSKAPMLVMGAYDDALVPPGDVLRTSDVYSAPLRMFHGMGHDMMLDVDWALPLETMETWLLDNYRRTEFPSR